MKKLLGIVVIGLLLSGNAYGKVGKGDFQMNEDVLEYLLQSLKNRTVVNLVCLS